MQPLLALVLLVIWGLGWWLWIKHNDNQVNTVRDHIEGMVLGFCGMVLIAFFGGIALFLLATVFGL